MVVILKLIKIKYILHYIIHIKFIFINQMVDQLNVLVKKEYISNQKGLFITPAGLALDDNYLYVADSGNHRVQVLDKENGKFIYQWGIKGSKNEGEFSYPEGLHLDLDNFLYVSDWYRIQVFTKQGHFIQYIGKGIDEWGSASGEFDFPKGIYVINHKVYIADEENHRIQVFS